MKNSSVLLLLFVLYSCNKSEDKTILDLLVQNNKYYSVQLEEYKLELEQQREDDPRRFDEEYFKSIGENFDAIQKLKNKSDYDTIFEKIKGLGYENKIGKTIKSILSDEKEVLKNNLYVNLLNVIHAKKLNSAISSSTRCGTSEYFKIVKKIENDSVSLDFYTFNNYQINIDSIKDGNVAIYDYKSGKVHKVWNIKYKAISKNTNCRGKIFFTHPYFDNFSMVQEFDDKNALSENPF
ncbi:hypothetical protein [Flavobacterium sp. UBA7682]|uniref:hypothetical protein n=1 Tax=Flavobacterium sp. UBA7682 TaxID=1946560 RepID=UPI0025BF45CE|nr:hypothetical protein [Flavobacterium sp. UBA7682]